MIINSLKRYIDQKNIIKITHVNLIFFIFFMISDCVDVYIPLILSTFTDSAGFTWGIFQSVTFILRMLIILYVGKMQYQSKKKLLLSFVMYNLLLLVLLNFWNSNFLFYISFGLLVVTRSVVNIILNPVIARLCSKETLGITFGVRDIFLSLGSFVGLVVSGFLAEKGLSSLLITYIIFCVVTLLLLVSTLKLDKVSVLTCGSDDLKNKRSKVITTNFVVFCSVCSLISIATSFQIFMPTLGIMNGISDSNIFYLISVSTAITAIMSLLGGILIDRFNKKKIMGAYIIICLVSILLLLSKTILAYSLCLFVLGVRAVFDNIEQAYFFDYFSSETSDELWSIHSGFQTGIGFILPPLIGILIDTNYYFVILLSLVSIIISYFMSVFLRQVRRV